MDNNQNNGQNGYTNFNNYQPTDPNQNANPSPDQNIPPQQPAQGYQAPQGNPYQQQNQYQQYPYQAVQPQENRGLALGIISIVLDCLTCCFAYTAFAGAILGLVGVIRNKKSVVSWIGLILGALLSIAVIIYLVYAFTHPEFLRSILEQSGLYDQETLDEMMKLFGSAILNIFN